MTLTASCVCSSSLQAVHPVCQKHGICVPDVCRQAKKLEYFATSHLDAQNGIQRTPCGLTFVTEWGSCRHAAGAAAVLAVYARHLAPTDSQQAAKLLDFARKQVCCLCLLG